MRTLFLDMDGTVCDLYGKTNWLWFIMAEQRGLFENLKPLVNIDELTRICKQLIEKDWIINIISWTPKNVTNEYIRCVEEEKKRWVSKFMPYVENVYILDYGVSKQSAKYKGSSVEVLVDDNKEVCEKWNTPKRRSSKTVTKHNNVLAILEKL